MGAQGGCEASEVVLSGRARGGRMTQLLREKRKASVLTRGQAAGAYGRNELPAGAAEGCEL